jgi:homoserine acetyltransferase
MFGKNLRLNPLELRKQLLIAESELNRAQLMGDIAAMTEDVRMLTDRAKSFGSIASSAAMLVTGLAALRHGRSTPADEKPLWWQTILKGAQLAGSIWSRFRTRPR